MELIQAPFYGEENPRSGSLGRGLWLIGESPMISSPARRTPVYQQLPQVSPQQLPTLPEPGFGFGLSPPLASTALPLGSKSLRVSFASFSFLAVRSPAVVFFFAVIFASSC